MACSTVLFLLNLSVANWTVQGIMSVTFQPLDSKDEGGSIAAGWIMGVLVLIGSVLAWGCYSFILWQVPVDYVKTFGSEETRKKYKECGGRNETIR